jgi:hypothetical protein
MKKEEREKLVLELYKSKHLVSIDPDVRIGMLKDEEVLRADAQGLLVGTNGYLTLFGRCPACSWKDHEHIAGTREARLEGYAHLMEEHAFLEAKMNRPCSGTVHIDERSR